VTSTLFTQAYLELAKRVDEAIQFMNACGLDSETAIMRETEFFVSHEALLLDYEEALTRRDSTTGRWCATVTEKLACVMDIHCYVPAVMPPCFSQSSTGVARLSGQTLLGLLPLKPLQLASMDCKTSANQMGPPQHRAEG